MDHWAAQDPGAGAPAPVLITKRSPPPGPSEKPSGSPRVTSRTSGAEGAHVTYLGLEESQLGHKESMKDTVRVLGRMFDGIVYRGAARGHSRPQDTLTR